MFKENSRAPVTSFHLDGKEQTEASHNYYKSLFFFKELISLREKKISLPLPFNKGFGPSWDTHFLIDSFSLPLIPLIIWCVLSRWRPMQQAHAGTGRATETRLAPSHTSFFLASLTSKRLLRHRASRLTTAYRYSNCRDLYGNLS